VAARPQARSVTATAAAASGGSSGSRWSRGLQELSSGIGLRGGSTLITLDLARQMLGAIGGRLQLSSTSVVNALTGQLEAGSNIEVWLPAPTPGVS
jgi:hypothetical protein